MQTASVSMHATCRPAPRALAPRARANAAPAARRELRVLASLAGDAGDASALAPVAEPRRGLSAGLGGLLLAAAPLPLALPALFGDGGGSGGGGSGGGGGGGDGGGSGAHDVLALADASSDGSDGSEEEEEEEAESASEDDAAGGGEEGEEGEEGDEVAGGDADAEVGPGGAFFCDEIRAEGLPAGEGIPTEEDLFAGLNCQPGFGCSRAELSQDIKQLYNTGLFESVNARVLPRRRGKFSVVFDFVEKRYPEVKTFAVEGAKVLPPAVVADVQARLAAFAGQPFTMEAMAAVKNAVEGWYHARGFGLSYISHFTGMPTGDVVAHVVEGRTAKVGVVYVDEDGAPAKTPGSIPAAFILKHVPVEAGGLYNMNDGRKALQNVFALDLFDNVQVFPRQNEKDPARVEVDVMVREKPVQTADLELEWAVAPTDAGRPGLVSAVPGGTITWEHRNLGGRAASAAASVNAKNFLAPADDLSYRFVYSQPFLHGLDDPRATRLSATAFNARKLCGVFTPGPGGEEVPPVWVDRAGVKVGVEERYSRASRGSLALVAQEVVARDEGGAPCARGMRATPLGQYVADGPPTTLSGTGRDRVLYAQASLVRDTTHVVAGQQLGARDVFTVDQGLGIGSRAPFFNRATAELTRFFALTAAPAAARAPPVALVLHARVGAALGDLPAYDAFLLGGPHSVRGYAVGELAACRRFAEAAAEVRVPLPLLKRGQQAYAFAEAGSDLGSSAELAGCPTEYYRRVGRGASYGGGVKAGALRVEAARDCNKGRWHALVAYGERF